MPSVRVLGIGPGGKPGDHVEFLQKGADDLIRVVLRAELLKLSHDSRERRVNIRDGALGIVRALSLEALLMLDEFFSVELRDRVLRADRPRNGHEAWHADPRG